jgi:hypothetical protein
MIVLQSLTSAIAEAEVGVQASACRHRFGASIGPVCRLCPIPFASFDILPSRLSYIAYRKSTRPVSPGVAECRRVSPPPSRIFPGNRVSLAFVQPNQGQSNLIQPSPEKNLNACPLGSFFNMQKAMPFHLQPTLFIPIMVNETWWDFGHPIIINGHNKGQNLYYWTQKPVEISHMSLIFMAYALRKRGSRLD